MRLLNLSCQLRASLNHCDEYKILKLLPLIELKLFVPYSLLDSFYLLKVIFLLVACYFKFMTGLVN